MSEKDVQLKIKIKDFNKIKNYLISKGAIFLGCWKEKTIRFDTEDKLLESNGMYLRVKSGNENALTLKEINNTDNKKFFEAMNTKFQIDDIDSLCYIFDKIGFSRKYVMEKYRLAWIYKEIEFYIDELPFGIFMEIKGEKKDISKMLQLLKVNDDEIIKITYWEIYAKLKHKENNYQNENIIFDKKHIFKIATM